MDIKEFVQKHKVLTPIIFWGFWVLLIIVPIVWRGNGPDIKTNTSNVLQEENSSYNCLMRKLSRVELADLAAEGGIDISELSEEYIQEILNRPLCREVCLQQLDYSKKYSDWFAENDLRETCQSLGINLPD